MYNLTCRLKLKSKPVLNQGCVLDGFPKTYEQAKALYEEVDEDGEALSNPDPQMAPEMVIDLTATEEFLKHRMMSLPEEVVQLRVSHLYKTYIYDMKIFPTTTVVSLLSDFAQPKNVRQNGGLFRYDLGAHEISHSSIYFSIKYRGCLYTRKVLA